MCTQIEAKVQIPVCQKELRKENNILSFHSYTVQYMYTEMWQGATRKEGQQTRSLKEKDQYWDHDG